MDRKQHREALHSIDWSTFETAYGSATWIPHALCLLLEGTKAQSLDASHKLWSGLCHQHAYVSSAALPALPFILDALGSADSDLAVELLDILLGFARCTAGKRAPVGWQHSLRNALLEAQPLINTFLSNADPDVVAEAELVLEELQNA